MLTGFFFYPILTSMRFTRKKITRFVLVLASLYVIIGVIIYFIQDILLFHPKPLSKEHKYAFTLPFEEINLPVEERNLNIIQFKPDSAAKGVVLYFHGNMKNIERYASITPLFTSEGYEIWMMDYPGFGKSTGKRTEVNIYSDAATLYGLALKKFSADQVIIYGRSIGTGPASHLASKQTFKKLILETPYYSIDALAKNYFPIYPVQLLSKYSFPVGDHLKNVKSEVYLIHGTDDEVVPYSQSQKIKKENTSVHLISIKDGKHNNLAEFELFRITIRKLLYE